VFAYQLGFGVSKPIGPNYGVLFGYRYFQSEDPDFTNASGVPFESEYTSHNLELGVQFDL
jgi:opacity protein-like surface antigen